jgi:hypothetical protein
MDAIKHFLSFLEKCCLPVAKIILLFINFCVDYTGRLAEIVKGLMFAVLYGFLFLVAFYSWIWLVQLSLRIGEPLCYFVPALWIGIFAYAILVLVTAGAYDEDKHFFKELRANA